jgi:hypothetical protein
MPPREAHRLGTRKPCILSVQKLRNLCAHSVKNTPIYLDTRCLDGGYWAAHLLARGAAKALLSYLAVSEMQIAIGYFVLYRVDYLT